MNKSDAAVLDLVNDLATQSLPPEQAELHRAYNGLLHQLPSEDRSRVENDMEPLGGDMGARIAFLRAELARRGLA